MKKETKTRLILYLAVAISLAVILSLGIFENPEFNKYDFFSGLAVETVGLLFAICIIEVYINYTKNIVPAKVLVRDMQLFSGYMVNVYSQAYMEATDQDTAPEPAKLFTRECFETILSKLDVDSLHKGPRLNLPWSDYLHLELNQIINKGENIISNHSELLREKYLWKIHYLVNSSILLIEASQVNIVRDLEKGNGTARDSAVLGQYIEMPSEQEFGYVTFLYESFKDSEWVPEKE